MKKLKNRKINSSVNNYGNERSFNVPANSVADVPDRYYNNGLNFTTRGLTAMYGFGLATPLGNKGTASFTYYLPNKEFNTKRIFGISVNYFLI